MNLRRVLSLQANDFLAYFAVPVFAVLTPGTLSRRLIRRLADWRWLLGRAASEALEGAARHGVVDDPETWVRQWKTVELLDMRDLYMLLFGRARTVLAEIDCSQPIGNVRGRPVVSMHWGPGISVLRLMAEAGLDPSIPYRPAERELLRIRPFRFVASWLAVRYLVRTLGDGAVPVGRAKNRIAELLGGAGSPCVVMDAPPLSGQRTAQKTVLGRMARFQTGFPAMLVASGKEYFLFAMNVRDDGSLMKRLELSGPFRADSIDSFLDHYAGFLDRNLSGRSWHWRIWQVEGQLWH